MVISIWNDVAMEVLSMADKRLSAEPLVEGLGRSSLPWRLG